MYFPLSVVYVILLCAVSAITQSDNFPRAIWPFRIRLTLANGEGNSDPNRPTSFAEKDPVNLNLNGPFSMICWLRVSDRRFWRAAISIESPDASSALFRIAIPPDQMMFNVAWMKSAQARGGAINTTAIAPGPNTDFHFALVKDENDITIYIDGEKKAFHTLNTPIFNPGNKKAVLGRTKLDGHSNRSQWNGVIRDMYIFNETLTVAIVKESQKRCNGACTRPSADESTTSK
ncbi:hypothetical protein GALMADRAFT_1362079 [Galerina marginata CBS 339.88]|uniref:LamG-like jellyroll fold domain-containing protein n=1 Tax=Galerina marginata (strain CBS 339.88) TaxID=685588 RepID=A0A067S8C6_GALM3|nr:hypothetical protein GALMADRAFT_1362079 [Galerina marginata CBS 339.88]